MPPGRSGAPARGWVFARSNGSRTQTQNRAWQDGGSEALRSRGPVSRERLSALQWARLELELGKGPLAHGFASDQRWTLGRIKTLIGRLFHVGYTVQGTWKVLRRPGWACQVPGRQAGGRGGQALEDRRAAGR